MHRFSPAVLAAVAVALLPATATAEPAGSCAELFAGSTAVAPADVTHAVAEGGTVLDVLGVADGLDLLGVVVEGGGAQAVYRSAPFTGLRAPGETGTPISGWAACGVAVPAPASSSASPTSVTDERDDTSEPAAPSRSEEPGASGSAAGAEALPADLPAGTDPASATTTGGSAGRGGDGVRAQGGAVAPDAPVAASAAVDPAAEDAASTPGVVNWLVAVAVLLLIGGGVLFLVLRGRAARG